MNRQLSQALPLPLALLLVSGCGLGRDIEPDAVCEEAALAVGARFRACATGDAAGVAEAQAFRDGVACDPSQTELEYALLYECVDAMNDLTCAQVAARDQDWQAWLDVSPVCVEFLTADGSTGDDDTGG
jgi:hypothetical protein